MYQDNTHLTGSEVPPTKGAVPMSKLRVHAFSISIDGYGAGPNQDIDNPIGVGGLGLHKWVFATRGCP
jgi:hypothetical protein